MDMRRLLRPSGIDIASPFAMGPFVIAVRFAFYRGFACTMDKRRLIASLVARWQVALPSFRSPLLALVATFTSVICVLILPSTFVSREEKDENLYFPPYLPSVFPLGSSLRNHQRNATQQHELLRRD